MSHDASQPVDDSLVDLGMVRAIRDLKTGEPYAQVEFIWVGEGRRMDVQIGEHPHPIDDLELPPPETDRIDGPSRLDWAWLVGELRDAAQGIVERYELGDAMSRPDDRYEGEEVTDDEVDPEPAS